jgi:hypothetical protein
MKNRISWDNALGLAFDVPPKGQRSVELNGYYTELALKFETWLRDIKGYTTQVEYEEEKRLRREFFFNHIEKHPEWFTDSGYNKVPTYQISNYEETEEFSYSCSGCQRVLDGILYTHKHK